MYCGSQEQHNAFEQRGERGVRSMNQTDKILKQEMTLRKKTLVGIAIAMTIFYILSIAFCVSVHSATKNVIQDQAVRSITNISQLNKDSVSRAITNRRTLLETLSIRLSQRGTSEPEDILHELADFGSQYDFFKIGFMDKTKTVYLTDGTVMDVSEVPLASQIWDDTFHLSESYAPYTGGEYMVNTFSYPVFRDGEIAYVLIGHYYSVKLTERMNISSMEGKGDTFLLDRKGNVVIYPKHYEDEEYNALVQYINDATDILPDTSGGRYDRYFTYDGARYYSHFEALGINDWFLMTCVKESDIFAGSHAITGLVYLLSGTLWLIILFTIGCTFYSMRRTRLRRTREIFYDELLGIPNRKALSVVYEHLPAELTENMYLVLFDIDKFKEFNYLYGSDTGDQLLRYIVKVLHQAEPDVYLFRYMSDYFVALDTCPDKEQYTAKINAVVNRFAKDIEAGVIPPFDISAGVCKLQPGESLQRTISDALVARGTIKGNHLRPYAFYDAAIRDKRLAYMEIETTFPAALRNGEFKVYYQPKFDMVTGKIIGAEALSRWIRPDGKMLSPGDFIPCLESSRQIMKLDEYILREVCRQMKEMTQEGLEVRRISVNLSRMHLRHPGILPKIAAIIHQSGVDPANLSFEITETVLVEDSSLLQSIVSDLHSLGCKVEMDDYGVGVSGPNSLAQNNFDVVKLDKSLADGLGNERVEDVIRSTAHMARKWGMDVLVEGVETLI